MSIVTEMANMKTSTFLFFVIVLTFEMVLSRVTFILPQNGSYVIKDIGTERVRFACRHFKGDARQFTQWSISFFRGVARLQNVLDVLPNTVIRDYFRTTPQSLFNDSLIFPEFIPELVNTDLYCGTDDNYRVAVFYLRKTGYIIPPPTSPPVTRATRFRPTVTTNLITTRRRQTSTTLVTTIAPGILTRAVMPALITGISAGLFLMCIAFIIVPIMGVLRYYNIHAKVISMARRRPPIPDYPTLPYYEGSPHVDPDDPGDLISQDNSQSAHTLTGNQNFPIASTIKTATSDISEEENSSSAELTTNIGPRATSEGKSSVSYVRPFPTIASNLPRLSTGPPKIDFRPHRFLGAKPEIVLPHPSINITDDEFKVPPVQYLKDLKDTKRNVMAGLRPTDVPIGKATPRRVHRQSLLDNFI